MLQRVMFTARLLDAAMSTTLTVSTDLSQGQVLEMNESHASWCFNMFQ